MALRANDPRPQHRQIADDLRQQIRTGDLGPGDKLPTIKELMASYDVHNQTVQAALKILQTEALTQGVPGRGTFVRTDLDLDHLSHGEDTGPPSAEYVALRDQLEDLVDQVEAIHRRLAQIEDRLPQEHRASKRSARS
jgi:DNA-binding transcriptional regulator YhcF (GntR family)